MRQKDSAGLTIGLWLVRLSTGHAWEMRLENPNLPYTLIKEILMGLDELDENEKTEYKFG